MNVLQLEFDTARRRADKHDPPDSILCSNLQLIKSPSKNTCYLGNNRKYRNMTKLCVCVCVCFQTRWCWSLRKDEFEPETCCMIPCLSSSMGTDQPRYWPVKLTNHSGPIVPATCLFTLCFFLLCLHSHFLNTPSSSESGTNTERTRKLQTVSVHIVSVLACKEEPNMETLVHVLSQHPPRLYTNHECSVVLHSLLYYGRLD